MRRRMVEIVNADGSRSRWLDGRQWCGAVACADAEYGPCDYHRLKARAPRAARP